MRKSGVSAQPLLEQSSAELSAVRLVLLSARPLSMMLPVPLAESSSDYRMGVYLSHAGVTPCFLIYLHRGGDKIVRMYSCRIQPQRIRDCRAYAKYQISSHHAQGGNGIGTELFERVKKTLTKPPQKATA